MKSLTYIAVALLATACEQDNDQATPEPTVDMARADGAVDAAPVDAAPGLDTGPDALPPDAQVPPDAAPVVDAGPDACDQACARFADCAIELCAGIDEGARAGLLEACGAACGANPAFATVINGAATCETVVDFGRDSNPDFADACRAPETPLEPDGSECPYACEGAEVCFQGQCVRPDGTCATDYHCRPTHVCEAGACVTGQFAECRAESDCSGSDQTCRSFSQNPLDPGNCYFACEQDDDCPMSEECNVDAGNICYYAFCGGGTPNGRVFGECRVGAYSGTCYPLAEGQASPQGTSGICLEADGEVPVGGACDAQAEARTPEDRLLQCAPGGICFGDPDDPRQPGAPLDGQGQCTALCDPRDPVCPAGNTCLDFSTLDDPATEFDETTYLGACLPSDCDLLAAENPCGEGRACRPYVATSTAGLCTEVGQVASGEACAESDDCAGVAICGNNGVVESACLAICDPAAEADCLIGQVCYSEPDWVIGFCVPGGP